MTMQLKIDKRDGGRQVVFISGSITEEADFKPLTGLEGGGSLRIDLSGVEQINSCGVREWIHFMRRLSRTERPFEFVRCSPAIVRQLNMISNFRGGGTVRSVMLPYYCDSCGHEQHQLLMIPASGELPDIDDRVTCSSCGEVAEFDDLPHSYTSFAA